MSIVLRYFRESWQAATDGWERFWFTPADPATLGLIRVLAGAMLLYTHFVWTLDLDGFFGPHSRLSLEYVREYQGTVFAWSYLNWIESPALLWTAHIAALIVLALMMLGLATRVTTVLSFLITVAYVHRAPGALFGLDQINAMLAMYLMLGPSGACYSLDRLRAQWRGTAADLDAPSVSANIAIRLMQLHMCLIYLFAGLGKLLGATWWDGTAMWGALANYEYQSLDVTFLAAWPLVINFLTHLTVAWETTYAVLVWPRLTRPIVIALAIPLHLGIAMCMGMITFGLVMLIGNASFISPALVRWLIPWPAEQGRGGGKQPAPPELPEEDEASGEPSAVPAGKRRLQK